MLSEPQQQDHLPRCHFEPVPAREISCVIIVDSKV